MLQNRGTTRLQAPGQERTAVPYIRLSISRHHTSIGKRDRTKKNQKSYSCRVFSLGSRLGHRVSRSVQPCPVSIVIQHLSKSFGKCECISKVDRASVVFFSRKCVKHVVKLGEFDVLRTLQAFPCERVRLLERRHRVVVAGTVQIKCHQVSR